MKLTMIGTGYVGLVTGTCFAESGNDVTCLDVDTKKIDKLRAGHVPIYEPGLKELIERNARTRSHGQPRLRFESDYEQAIPVAEVVFICVGTPQDEDGRADLKYVFKAVEQMAPLLSEETIVVVKSTVPVGTNQKVYDRLRELTGRHVRVCSNPEFLKEGAAIDDFTRPDRVVVGYRDKDAADVLHKLYQPFLRADQPFLEMSVESAEMTKYVANCMLATKISFINEMANLCERVGADVNEVRRGIGHDQRIGFSFLFPGVGYGGSCFPKDVRALVQVGLQKEFQTRILRIVDEVNTQQKEILFQKLHRYFNGDLIGRTIAVWGLSFKPRTDDIREAPALVLIDHLLKAGASVRVHDPEAQKNVQEEYGDQLIYCDHHYDALDDADALCVVTEWNQYRNPDFDYMLHKLKSPVIFDGRNLYSPEELARLNFYYSGIGIGENGRY